MKSNCKAATIDENVICETVKVIFTDLVKKMPRPSTAKEAVIKEAVGGSGSLIEERHPQHSQRQHSYLLQQVFTCDEMNFFWKKIPNRTYITAEENALPSHKPMMVILRCYFVAMQTSI